MIHPSTEIGFEVSVSGRDEGTLEAIYVRFSKGRVARTEELQEDVLLADYDAHGQLIGLEILAPVRLRDLVRAKAGRI